MAAEILAIFRNTVTAYTAFAKRVRRPALKQFMYTIVSYLQRHVEELQEGMDDFPDTLEYATSSWSELILKNLAEQVDDLEGLQVVLRHIRSSHSYFEELIAQAGGDEARTALIHYRDDALKLARLVEDRLELESL